MNKFYKTGAFYFILPSLFLFVFIIAFPLFKGFYYSLTDWDGIARNINFIGFRNYLDIVTKPAILIPLRNSVLFTLITLVLDNVFGLGLAVLLNGKGQKDAVLRLVFFLPFIISLVVSSYMWTYLYSSVIYPVFGIQNPLGDPKTSNLGVALISVWRNTGYCMLIYIAGLKSIPHSLYESAAVEGAGPVKRFFNITLPLLMPSFSVNITLILAWGLKEFDTVMVATGGGPGRSSMSLAYYVYKTTFVWGKAGYGQAVAIAMMAFIVLMSTLVARALRAREVEF